jgi:peptide-methionine (S)-S-oxide reductase
MTTHLRRGAALPFVLVLGLAACRSSGSTGTATAEPKPAVANEAPAAVVSKVGTDPGGAGDGTPLKAKPGNQLAAFAGGCFWGTEDTFRHVDGVVATAVGYTGGHTQHPTYEDVCTHTTGHAETVLVEFDPKLVTYEQLLDVFFQNHDPTTMNRQGPDVGDQYRSEVFTFDAAQRTAAAAAIGKAEKRLGKHVVTAVSAIGPFWKAEDYHQQWDEKAGKKSCKINL